MRYALAAVVGLIGFGLAMLSLAWPSECHDDNWPVFLLQIPAAALLGAALLVALWRRQNLWWIAALTAFAVWVLLFLMGAVKVAGPCIG